MLRSRYFAIFGLLAAFVVATAVAQEKKDETKKDDTKKVEAKKDETKKDETKKDETKKDETKKGETKKDETKKDETKKDELPALSWKFEKDKPFYQKMETVSDQSIKVMGLDVVQKQEQTFYFKWTPIEQDKDGNWKITQEIQGLKMKIDIAGNPVAFDSTQDNPPGGANTALSEFFKALKDSKFTLTFNSKTLKVDKVEGRDEFIRKLATANQQLQPLLNKILSDDALRQMADPTFGILPPPGKKAGDTWDTTTELNLGPIGKYSNKYKYKWVPQDANTKDKDVETITVDVQLTYTAPADSDPQLPFKIKSSTLKTKEVKDPVGKIMFNTKTGRVESSDMTIEMSGTLLIEIGGNSTSVELTQKQTTKVETKSETLLPKPPEMKKP